MDRLLAKLERRLGSLAIEGLPLIIVVGMVVAYMLARARPEILGALSLDLEAVRNGQYWRLVSFLFLPESMSLTWLLFVPYFTWLIGSSLEQEWGAFKLNVYYLLGMLGTTASAWLAHNGVGSTYLNLSLLFAFATLAPDFEVRLYLIIPIKMKWLAILSAAFLAYKAAIGDWAERAAILAAVSNYFIFFGGHLVGLAQGRRVLLRQAARRESYRAAASSVRPDAPEEGAMGGRVCAVCGAKEADGADIRICSCAQCGGVSRTLCLEHAKGHAAAARTQANA